jgi:hypothetical protein
LAITGGLLVDEGGERILLLDGGDVLEHGRLFE